MASANRRRLLHNRDYVSLLGGQTVSSLGSAMSTFVFTLLAVAITGSAVQAGLVAAANALGSTLASLPAGALVDRWNRKTILVSTAAAGAVLYASVAVAIGLDRLTIGQLAVVAFCTGVMRAFFLPSQNAALRAIVSKEDMGMAMAANEGREHFAGLVGAPLGGLLYSVARIVPVMLDALSYLFLAIAFMLIRKPLPAPAQHGDRESVIRAIRSGISWVAAQPAIRVIALVATFINFCAQAIMLMLIVSLRQRGVSSGIIGLLETGLGVGGLLGALAASTLVGRYTTGRIAVVAAWVIAAAFAATAATTRPAVLVVLLGAAVFFVPALNAGLFGYQVLVTPDNMQGRAQSAIGFLATSTSSLAPLAGGFLLEGLGARGGILILGGILAVAALAITLSAPIRQIPLLADVVVAEDRPVSGTGSTATPGEVYPSPQPSTSREGQS